MTETVPPRDFFDFDSWAAEHTQAPIRFRLLGKDWDLPGDVPASVMLQMQKLEVIAETGIVPDGVDLSALSIEALVGQMVGDDILTEWLSLGITQQMLRMVSGRLYALHMGGNPDAGSDPTEDQDDESESGDLPEAGEPGKAE